MKDIIKMIEELAKEAGSDGVFLAVSSIALLGLAMVAKGEK
ncbi:hypothetical protein [Castellaniella caeni]|nr:hypothetical protein [Castellaniella caeni]